LREASKSNYQLVLDLCQKWAGVRNPNTDWIIKDGMKKLPTKEQEILKSLMAE
jgi:3-methyladenine DNA glycosylase AlkC